MKYLLVQILIAIVSVTFLYYLSTLDYFLPTNPDGTVNWYNVTVVLFGIFMFFEGLIATIVYLLQKFMAFGWKEFPGRKLSLNSGIIFSLIIVALILLNVIGLVTLSWGVVIFGVILLLAILFYF
ncbi:MAG: hypothetical protein QY318_02185 [Candidatus Dojkabacteria bacterium]|nr:MAG: hypothetical protein QY318_02185 [Candidatus Dojkabacteria bacterium]